MARFIGIRHRTKKTTVGEARPTQVCIVSEGKIRLIELETETDELDFVLGIHPVEFRPVDASEDVSRIARRFLKTKRLKKGEDPTDYSLNLLVHVPGEKRPRLVTHVPSAYEGLKKDDVVAMSLGGSGDRMAFALSRRGLQIGASVLRTPPSTLKKERGDGNKENDANLLAELVQQKPSLFYETGPRDRQLIAVREAYRALMDAMKDRIACEQRLRQRLIGSVFLSEEGKYPEGSIENDFDEQKASDVILQSLVKEEQRREAELSKALEKLDIFTELFQPVEGCGTRIAARLISSILTARRFEVQPDQAMMNELQKNIGACLELGQYYADKRNAEHLFPPNHNGLMRIQAVAKWKREHGKEDEADLLTEAVAYMQERRELTKQATQKGAAKLRKYCGVAPTADGKFPRRRKGEAALWSPDARQALYLLGEQCNRRPDSVWGQRLRENKVALREKHPEVECSTCHIPWDECTHHGKSEAEQVVSETQEMPGTEQPKNRHVRRYTDGHIHKMAIWKTASQFVTWLFGEWLKIEGGKPTKARARNAA